MDNFYMTVIIVAIIALIGVLTYVGMIMAYGEGTEVYPPQSTTCPDYWVIDENKKCKIPSDGDKNTGSLYESGLLSYSAEQTIGIEGTTAIDFAHDDWKASGQPICAKQTWAKTHNVVWDGISNYNDC
tara:strand:- start:1475 stop:1858 length:384 start_codon:yes stop_codon:yes gene_type:complete